MFSEARLKLVFQSTKPINLAASLLPSGNILPHAKVAKSIRPCVHVFEPRRLKNKLVFCWANKFMFANNV